MGASPTRIDEDVFAAAKVAAAASSRSAAQQINHWARIGRALEASGNVRAQEILDVLAGRASYDELGRHEQAVVRAEWDEQAIALRRGLDLEAEFRAEGTAWVDADATGRTVHQPAASTAAPKRTRRRAS